jgi:serine/threonine-protein kinase
VADRRDDSAAGQIRFRRSVTVATGIWCAFLGVDFAVAHWLHAGNLVHFVAIRAAAFVVLLLVLLRTSSRRTVSRRELTAADLSIYVSGAVGIALMCIEFRGIASPYVPGLCLVLLARTITADDPWRRGLVMSGIPVLSFFVVLLGSALFSSRIAAQLGNVEAVMTFIINSAYVLGTYVFLVGGAHIVWSLRRQIFEARSLGRYRLKKRLAAGGMGEVWLAYHPGLKRDVAVKILKTEEQERSSSALSRFEREVRATAELNHPNTVRVYDYGATEDGLWYYVMELLEGETLAQHVTRLGALPPARAVHVVGQAARAIAEAHDHGIVHRDVKPENLFLTALGGEHDFVKVIDFGIAKVSGTGWATMTGTGWVLGTPAYISPEVAIGEPADARSDVYALGAVLYFLLCGRPPFEADNVAGLLFAHVNHHPPPPSTVLGRSIPPDVEAVVLRALEKDPARRYPSGAELALALAECRVAGKWTFGDATDVARKSSRPPPSDGRLETMPSLKAPRVPAFAVGK